LKMDLTFGLAILLIFLTVSAYQTNENDDRLVEYYRDELADENDENESLRKLLENDEENDLIDLNDEDTDDGDFHKNTAKKDPLWRRWRIRVRRFVPRIRIRRFVPRIRIRKIRFRKLRRIIRVPRIRFRLRKIRFPKLARIFRRPNPEPAQPKIDCSHATTLYNRMGCDPAWNKHVASVFVDEVYRSACFKHKICTSCMQSQPWTKTKCDSRLKTDMEASCNLITDDTNKPDAGLVSFCKSRVFGLHILETIKTHPATAAAHCDQCIIPSGNPNVPVNLQ